MPKAKGEATIEARGIMHTMRRDKLYECSARVEQLVVTSGDGRHTHCV